MRIILGKSNTTNSSSSNNNTTTDFSSIDSNAATAATTRGTHRTSSPSIGGVVAPSADGSVLSVSLVENSSKAIPTHNRKRKTLTTGDFVDCKKPAFLPHHQQPQKLGPVGNMVSSASQTKSRNSSVTTSVEGTAIAAASGGSSSIPQDALGTSDENNQRPGSQNRSQPTDVDEYAYPCYDPNNPAEDDEERGDEACPTVLNVARGNNSPSSLIQQAMLQQQYSASSSSSSSIYPRNSSNAHHKEASSTVALRNEKEFASVMKTQLKMEVVEMDGDGNCLFRAVALQVYGDVSMHNEVRRRCLEFMVSIG